MVHLESSIRPGIEHFPRLETFYSTSDHLQSPPDLTSSITLDPSLYLLYHLGSGLFPSHVCMLCAFLHATSMKFPTLDTRFTLKNLWCSCDLQGRSSCSLGGDHASVWTDAFPLGLSSPHLLYPQKWNSILLMLFPLRGMFFPYHPLALLSFCFLPTPHTLIWVKPSRIRPSVISFWKIFLI